MVGGARTRTRTRTEADVFCRNTSLLTIGTALNRAGSRRRAACTLTLSQRIRVLRRTLQPKCAMCDTGQVHVFNTHETGTDRKRVVADDLVIAANVRTIGAASLLGRDVDAVLRPPSLVQITILESIRGLIVARSRSLAGRCAALWPGGRLGCTTPVGQATYRRSRSVSPRGKGRRRGICRFRQ